MAPKDTKEKQRLESVLRQLKVKLTFFNEFLTSYEPNQLEELKANLNACEPYLREAEESFVALECLDNSAENQAVIDKDLIDFTKIYTAVIAKARSFLPRETSTPVSQFVNQVTSVESSVKLPSLNLPTFAGTYETWGEFRDTFKSLVHQNNALNNVQRFHYLKSCLKDDAARVIQALEATEVNYNIAWDLLKKRYENLRLIVNGHIKAIFDINAIQKENYMALRDLTDTLVRNTRCLESLELPVKHWDALLIYITTSKLDPVTKRDWESSLTIERLPTLDELIKFLNDRIHLLESIQTKLTDKHERAEVNNSSNRRVKANVFATTDVAYKCFICEGNHSVFQCESFKKLDADGRSDLVKQKRLCFNCLRSGHAASECKGKTCQKCDKRHHTLLHKEKTDSRRGISSSTEKRDEVDTRNTVACTSNTLNEATIQTLLSTANVRVYDNQGNELVLRALLDSGSQSNFLTLRVANLLGLEKLKVRSVVGGLGARQTTISSAMNITIKSLYSDHEEIINCLVIEKIADNIPTTSFSKFKLNIPEDVQLADVEFNKSWQVDLLLGSSVFWSCLQEKQIRLGRNMPILHQTRFGYILAGTGYFDQPKRRTNTFCAIAERLTRFWEQEELPERVMNEEDEECERFYEQTTKRENDGRFVVNIPFRKNVAELGESRTNAIQRFDSLEKRFARDENLSTQYKAFMSEYQALGHLSICEENERDTDVYYLAHHAVLKQSSSTTKLRAVFDGSAATSTGLSLNDVQLKGPTVQSDLFDILLRFRKYKYILNADIEKMYRQILINPSQRKYQRILWRSNPEEELKCYELNTITYGLTSSSYLATRCLKQLAIENQTNYPFACRAIRDDFYVNDLLTGADSLDEARNLRTEITRILETGRFNLRKWISNEKRVLDLDQTLGVEPLAIINLGKDESNKTLGLYWQPHKDQLHYSIPHYDNIKSVTKRTVLSQISQIYDPLNLLGPVHIRAKLFMQELWKCELNWDDSIQGDLLNKWIEYISSLKGIGQIIVPRRILVDSSCFVELHGFSDASLKAYAACIYVKSKNCNGEVLVNLLCAKSRVSPLRNVSLPRLELCGAVLLAKLMIRVKSTLKLVINQEFYWCDSTIALSWIYGDTRKWKTYVANRVSQIKTLSNTSSWYHVSTQDNAADVLTRGCNADFLKQHYLWWHGPEWLRDDVNPTPFQESHHVDNVEALIEMNQSMCLSVTKARTPNELFVRFSNYRKLRKVMAYLLRFIHNAKGKGDRRTNLLSVNELKEAEIVLLRLAQRESYEEEIRLIEKNEIPKKLSPHFGGLWEAAVKAIKFHLIRVASVSHLVFEEFYTLLTQVEAILNSRPLSPISSDPNDLFPLTPGHFIIGRPLTALIDENLLDTKCNRLLRYQRVQQIVQHFWKKWSKEYLCELQRRAKWQRDSAPLKVDDLVVIQEENLPPCKWLLGRVVNVTCGSDSIPRVVELRTKNGVIKRAVHRLCKLPKDNELE